MKLNFKFLNSTKEYLATTIPLAYTNDRASAFTLDVEADDLDDVFVDDYVEEVILAMLIGDNQAKYYIHIEDDSGVAWTVYEFDKSNISMLVKANATIPSEVHTTLRWLANYLTGVVQQCYLRTLSITKTTVNNMSNAGNTPNPGNATPAKQKFTEDEIEQFIESVKKHTKAEVVKPKETLSDYVCSKELKDELQEIVDFFNNHSDYVNVGVSIPKGVLFKGPWGTGKTFAARCIAGTVNCYFMTCTASALQGMYIGSGAENIRDLFKAAKVLVNNTDKGVIIFIDELDSFGDRENRSGNASGEEDRTLNQLLAEMSGFEETDKIMVLAATNFPEKLDSALMRSGRFGRQITISHPDNTERLNLVKHYFGKLKLPFDVDVDNQVIADLSKGLTPADIKEISNEAGILTVRQKLSKINLDNVNEAINKVITKDIRRPDDTKNLELVTAHECGHVLAEILYNKTYPIKVTNYAYGSAGGFTQSAEIFEGIISKERFEAEIKMLLAGRAAEVVVCGYITTGASSDLNRAKALIRSYFERYSFEQYKVAELDQLVEDKVIYYGNKVVDDFNEAKNNTCLKRLISMLLKERVLYDNELKLITKNLI